MFCIGLFVSVCTVLGVCFSNRKVGFPKGKQLEDFASLDKSCVPDAESYIRNNATSKFAKLGN